MWTPKRWLVMIGLTCALSSAQTPINKSYVEFLYKMDKFNRELVGCPLEPEMVPKKDCHPELGIFDVKLWRELQREAPGIFKSFPTKVPPKHPAER